MTFGQLVNERRIKMQLTLEEAAKQIEKRYSADKIRCSAAYLSMIENYKPGGPNLTLNLINSLIDFFDLPKEAIESLFPSLESKPSVSLASLELAERLQKLPEKEQEAINVIIGMAEQRNTKSS